MTQPKIDMHQHLWSVEDAEAMAREYERLGVVKAVLLGLPPRRVPGNNEVVLEAAKRFPDLFIPYAGIDIDQGLPEKLARFQEQGFKGVKFIAPDHPYDTAAYFATYEKACDLGLPALFHLGIVSNTHRWRDVNINDMRPTHLDFIARRLPELAVIGAHLGNPWYDEACMACRWNPNLCFDLSGSTLKKKSSQYLGDLLWWRPDSRPYRSPVGASAWDQILFGTDLAVEWIADSVNDYEELMTALALSPEERHAIYHGNAARILGVTS